MVKCNNCGAEVIGSDFCFNCGEKIEKFEAGSDICPKCGTKNNKNTNFCVECGHKLITALQFHLNNKSGMQDVMQFLQDMISLLKNSE